MQFKLNASVKSYYGKTSPHFAPLQNVRLSSFGCIVNKERHSPQCRLKNKGRACEGELTFPCKLLAKSLVTGVCGFRHADGISPDA